MVPGEPVIISTPDMPEPAPAAFVAKSKTPGQSVVSTPQGEVAVPNTAINPAAKAEAAAKLIEPVVTKVKDPTIGGWDVQIGQAMVW